MKNELERQSKRNTKSLKSLLFKNKSIVFIFCLISVIFSYFDLVNPIGKYKIIVEYNYINEPIKHILKCGNIRGGCNRYSQNRDIRDYLNANSSFPKLIKDFPYVQKWYNNNYAFYKVEKLNKIEIESYLLKLDKIFNKIRLNVIKENYEFLSRFENIEKLEIYNKIQIADFEKILTRSNTYKNIKDYSKLEKINDELAKARVYEKNLLYMKQIRNYLKNNQNIITFKNATYIDYEIDPILRFLMYISIGFLMSILVLIINYNLRED